MRTKPFMSGVVRAKTGSAAGGSAPPKAAMSSSDSGAPSSISTRARRSHCRSRKMSPSGRPGRSSGGDGGRSRSNWGRAGAASSCRSSSTAATSSAALDGDARRPNGPRGRPARGAPMGGDRAAQAADAARLARHPRAVAGDGVDPDRPPGERPAPTSGSPEGALRRKPVGPDKSNTRGPPAPLGPKSTGRAIAWGSGDHAPIPSRRARRRSSSTSRAARRAPDSLLGGFRDEVLADCAVKKTMGVTYMRHTAAM